MWLGIFPQQGGRSSLTLITAFCTWGRVWPALSRCFFLFITNIQNFLQNTSRCRQWLSNRPGLGCSWARGHRAFSMCSASSSSQERFTLKRITQLQAPTAQRVKALHTEINFSVADHVTEIQVPIFLPQDMKPQRLKPVLTTLFPQVLVKHLAPALSLVGLCSWRCPALSLSKRNRWWINILFQTWMCLMQT